MRRFLSLTGAFALFVFTGFAHAQHFDFAVGGSTLFSSVPNTASLSAAPAEKGGVYPDISAELIFKNRFGISADGAFRYKKSLYEGYQRYRPIFYDVNAVFEPRFTRKISADFMAGVGGESLLFYNQFSNCNMGNYGSCPSYINSNHLLLHAGGGPRYYFWRNLFARADANYYFIPNNVEFHSRNVLRLGGSIGYTWGER